MRSPLLLLLPALLTGQVATAQKLRFGAKAGVNYSNINPRLSPVFRNRLAGLNAGAMVRYALSNDGYWNLQTELLYSGKGKPRIERPNSMFYTDKERYHCLDLPVLLKVNQHGFTLEAGPQMSYLLGTVSDVGYGREFHPGKSVYLGYTTGMGYELESGYSLTVRYTSDVWVLPKSSLYRSNFENNSTFQAQLGYLLSSKRKQSANHRS